MRNGTAAVIGGGVIGGGWAARFLLNGWNVKVFDPDPEAKRRIGEVIGNARRSLPMLYERSLPEEGELAFVTSVAEAVAGVDYVQESVPERLELKRKVYAEVESVAPDVPLGSSTSGFKPSDLRKGLASGTRLFVAHPFNPVYLLPLVELVSGGGDADIQASASRILTSIGMRPLVVRAEIDAHIADRFLEAVWREALWLVRDDIATTGEIDDAIRLGLGLRWAQMGLFETYRIAGGEGGMAHFVEQFGPALAWPWTRLMDVPELTPDLVKKIGDQSDVQSGMHSIRELEALRDRNLVAVLRALKREGSAAGRVIADHEANLGGEDLGRIPMITVRRMVPSDWTDYNGHMNESRYGQVFSDAADAVLAHVGAGPDYVSAGRSFFTVSTKTDYLLETHAGETIQVETRMLIGEGKKLKLRHEMQRAFDGSVLATCEQFLLHVNLETRKSCDPERPVEDAIKEIADAHGHGRES
ncbi:MAG: carnitine 3-dehydrogenase [Boseongicola sp. SB0675_bin_26]|nr:carnitine 3-dehydrogenase [Boseongicola sp. SB0675_bin_26]